jgi:peptidyl-Lys metalloendopeptidase
MRAWQGASRIFVLAVVAGAPAAAEAQLKGPEGITINMEAKKAKVGATEPLTLGFSLRNSSAEPITVLKWNTPLEGFNSDMFTVTRDGKPVEYIGRVVKRGAPRPEDYVTVEPGGAVSADVDVAEGYAIWEVGRYDVAYRGSLLDAVMGRQAAGRMEKGLSAMLKPRANTVQFELGEARPPRKLPVAVPPPPSSVETAKAGPSAKAPTFKNCSSTQQATLNDAHTSASQLAAGSILALALTSEAKRPAAQRYKSWFGAYTATRYATVLDHFQKIHGAYVNQTVTFNCDCNQSWYAYVYANSPYEIHLCNAFWPAPMTGTDSKAGTIIHETSHFTVVAGTDDHVYGQPACRNLANSNPDDAIDNADSHEYFAENTPAESMGLAHVALALFTVAAALALGLRLLARRRMT